MTTRKKKKHRTTIITLIIIITLPCTVPAHGTTNTVTTSYSTDEDYIMQTRDTYHEHASRKPFSLFFHGKLNHSGKITAIKLSGIQGRTVKTLMSHLNSRTELLEAPLSPGTANDITDSTTGVRERLLTQLQALVKSSAVKEKCKSPGGWISTLVIKAGWNSLK